MVRISSTGEIIQDDATDSRQGSSGFGSVSSSQTRGNSNNRQSGGNRSSAFGTIAGIRSDESFSGQNGGSNVRSVFGDGGYGGRADRRGGEEGGSGPSVFTTMNNK